MFTFTNKSEVHKSMYIILALYYADPARIYRNNHAELFSLVEHFLTSQYSTADILQELSGYPVTAFPDVCICGHVYSSYNSILRLSCHVCLGRHSKQGYFSDYIFNKLSDFIYSKVPVNISNDKLKRILCTVIYNEYHRKFPNRYRQETESA